MFHQVNESDRKNNAGNTRLITKIALNFILDIFGQFIGKITIWQHKLFLKLKLSQDFNNKNWPPDIV